MPPADPSTADRAANDSAALFDLTGWTVLRLAGRDCVKFLHNFCTNDIKGLAVGEGCEAFLTNVKARVVGHALVFRDDVPVGQERGVALTLLAAPGQAERLAAHLDRYVITEDVTVTDATADTALLALVGPSAAEVLSEFPWTPPPEPPATGRFTSRPATIDGRPWSIRRADVLGKQTYFLQRPPERKAEARDRLIEAGAVPGGPEAFESLRIEAAFPLYGADVTEDHLAPEAGRPWAISYTKGCYLGQEPIARIDALGHVNRLLCGLRLDAGPAPDRGAAVLADGKEIGSVTSATISPADGRPVALAYLRTKFAEPGTAVTVRTANADIPATAYRATPP